MTRRPPAVPRAVDVDPLIQELDAGTEIIRVYDGRWGPTDFNPSDGEARFRPVRDARGSVVATAYGGLDDDTAICEAVLRGVSALARGGSRRRVYAAEIEGLKMARLACTRTIRVAKLHGTGLTRLGLLRSDVVDCPSSEYAYTARWARALWGCRKRPHGICWTSRQNDSAQAVMLWATRVKAGWLDVRGNPIKLDEEPGLDQIRRVCADAGVDFEP